MPGKTKEGSDKTSVLKGQEAEDAILKYLKKMNRPFGAVDVCANLKGAVPKTATQKALLSLADKGNITKKDYGKTTFFVANQSNLEDVPAEKLKALENELSAIEEENKELQAQVKAATYELTKVKNSPTDDDLARQVEETELQVKKTLAYLEPLRSGQTLISPEEMGQLDADWTKWRAEWVSRKKIYMKINKPGHAVIVACLTAKSSLWYLVTDSLPPQDAKDLAEELGIELDTTEHSEIEKGPLCVPTKRR